ncbi:MAG: ATP-binding protein [Planctomycetes bacterium]|nr:ATP-binding protein [Planctomycetota bacterium]
MIRLSIHIKVLVVVVGTLTVLAVALAWIAHRSVADHVAELEADQHRRLVRRVDAALAMEFDTLRSKISDWAQWDPAYAYMAERSPAFERENLIPSTFTGMHLGVIAFLDPQGRPVSVFAADSEGAPASSPADFAGPGPVPLPVAGSGGSVCAGGLATLADGRTALYVAAPILPGDGTGPARGTLVFLRWFEGEEVSRLARMSDLPLQAIPLAAAPLALDGTGSLMVVEPHADHLHGWHAIDDVRGNRALVLTWEVPRISAKQGDRLLATLMWSLAGLVGAAAALVLVQLHFAVVRPVARLGRELDAIAGSGEAGRLVGVPGGGDEIAALAGAINRSLAALGRAQDELRARSSELASARERAEAANRAKSAFLATMSHELRTPLNGVLGMAELLLGGETDAERRSRLEVIRASGEDLLELINDVLDLSKVEAERLELEQVRLHPWEIAERVLDLLAPRAHAKGVELAFIPGDGLPHALAGDSQRFRQVLTNLVGNAVKFTERGEVTVWADAEAAGAEVILRVAVSDTGPGMSAAVRDRLFQPFVQGDAGTARTYGGTGLGLAISRRLVELMGGTIEVDSEPGRGSTFAFTVRMARAGGSDDPEPQLPAATRVLVACAAPGFQHAVEAQLEWYGAEIVSESAVASLAVVDADHPEAAALMAVCAACAQPVPVLLLVGLRGAPPGLPRPARRLAKPVRRAALLAAVREPRQAPDEPSSAVALLPGVALRNGRVLAVDDQEVNRLVVVGHLRNLGCEPQTATGGAAAIALLAAKPFDLVLLDCQMPEVDGFSVVADLRAREAGTGAHTAVVALTANAMAGDRERCLAAGFDDHLAKPIRAEDLQRCLERWMPRGDTAAQAPEPLRVAVAPPRDDPQAVRAHLAGEIGAEAAGAVVAAFLNDAPRLVVEAGEALAGKDIALAARRAHALKGDAANLGLMALSQAAAELEQAAKAGDLSAARAAFGTLSLAWKGVPEGLAAG